MRFKFIRSVPVFIVVVLLMLVMVCTVSCSEASSDGAKKSETILTITKGDESKSYTMEELKSMPSVEASGCLRREDGTIEGPFQAKGVAVIELCKTVGGLGTDETAEFSCADGFVSLNYQHLTESNFKTYDAATGERCYDGALTILLAYEVDGKPLVEDSGGPLRVMILGGEDIATHGYLWMKGINKVDIHKWEGSEEENERPI